MGAPPTGTKYYPDHRRLVCQHDLLRLLKVSGAGHLMTATRWAFRMKTRCPLTRMYSNMIT